MEDGIMTLNEWLCNYCFKDFSWLQLNMVFSVHNSAVSSSYACSNKSKQPDVLASSNASKFLSCPKDSITEIKSIKPLSKAQE